MAVKKENVIVQKSDDFTLHIIKLHNEMQKHREYTISKQLLRSGTSIGANIAESLSAQSRADFVHKLSISLKEARETDYWLRLLQKSQIVPGEFSLLQQECDSII